MNNLLLSWKNIMKINLFCKTIDHDKIFDFISIFQDQVMQAKEIFRSPNILTLLNSTKFSYQV